MATQMQLHSDQTDSDRYTSSEGSSHEEPVEGEQWHKRFKETERRVKHLKSNFREMQHRLREKSQCILEAERKIGQQSEKIERLQSAFYVSRD